MEQEHSHQEDDANIPRIPDDISELIEDIHDRADQREKAIEICLEKARSAKNQYERDHWIVSAMEFGGILEEYKKRYPELFGDNDSQEPSGE